MGFCVLIKRVMQGLYKDEGKRLYGDQYLKWKKDPANFEIDGHFPVRELWYRASLCWQKILSEEGTPQVLVVAHNAINQVTLTNILHIWPI